MEDEELGGGVVGSCDTVESILVGGVRLVGTSLLSVFTLIGTGCVFFGEYLTIFEDLGRMGVGKAA